MNLVQTNKYFKKINNQLCKLVSNINNVSYEINKQIDKIQEKL